MPQKIKKQIKRSMPWLMIFSLLFSTFATGLVFNLDVKIKQSINKKFSLEINTPEAQAQNTDTATTTVIVRNAPPVFAPGGDAYESPTSTSTSPINVGAAISFKATSDDPENNSFYLIVCSTESVVASTTGGAPVCSATTFCTSTLTADMNEATCTYNNVTDPGSETRQWYAYVCDNHTSEGACSDASSQGVNPGIGDNSSPFYVNHAPAFTGVYTSTNYRDPGASFTVTATSTDTDVARGAELLHLYLCQTNSWATSTGCAGGQLCYATSTSPDIDCAFATTTPAKDGNWTYYAFVKDDFGMPAPQNSRNNTYTVNNVAPTVSAVSLNSNADITLNLKTASRKVVTATSTNVSDRNGCTDITSATGSVYWSSATGEYECTADDNNCYKIGSVNCTALAGSCTGSSDQLMTYTCTTSLAFYAVPTDAMSLYNPASTTNWLAAIKAFDEVLNGVGTSSAVDVNSNVALDVPELNINYGSVRSGRDTGTTTATTTVVNYGNTPLDTNMGGDDMYSGSNQITVDNQEYSLTYGFQWGTGTNLVASSSPALLDVDVARPTNMTDVLDYVYWGIGIPALKPSGTYTGWNLFQAALDDNGNWN